MMENLEKFALSDAQSQKVTGGNGTPSPATMVIINYIAEVIDLFDGPLI